MKSFKTPRRPLSLQKGDLVNKFVAIVGMSGAGKSIVADEFIKKGYLFFRFGQITMDILKERGLEVTESNERAIRESVRAEHGMGAFATMNIPKIDALLKRGNVVGDGLYSWSEYKILREKYSSQLIVLAVFAPPKLRYERLEKRSLEKTDAAVRNRKISREDAIKRDFAEIENIEKGGPIAMSDYTLLNTGTTSDLIAEINCLTKEWDARGN